jgi:regulator of nonsense transcripts 2
MWEDEEERRFYEDVVDLGEFVPGAILGVKQVEKGEDGGVKEKKENGIGPEGDDGEEEREKEKKEAEDVKRQLEKMDENGTAAEVDTVEEKKQDEVDPGVGDQTEMYVYLSLRLGHLRSTRS